MDHLSLQHPVIIHCGFLCRPIQCASKQTEHNKKGIERAARKEEVCFHFGCSLSDM